MAVLMTAHIPGGTKEMIDGMQPLLEQIRSYKVFVVHANGPATGRRIEVRRPCSTRVSGSS